MSRRGACDFRFLHPLLHTCIKQNNQIGLQNLGLDVSPIFGNIVKSVARHDSSKQPLFNIRLNMFNKHVRNSSFPYLNISTATPVASVALLHGLWLNTYSNSGNWKGGMLWNPCDEAKTLNISKADALWPTSDRKTSPK